MAQQQVVKACNYYSEMAQQVLVSIHKELAQQVNKSKLFLEIAQQVQYYRPEMAQQSVLVVSVLGVSSTSTLSWS